MEYICVILFPLLLAYIFVTLYITGDVVFDLKEEKLSMRTYVHVFKNELILKDLVCPIFNDKYTTIGKILFTIGWILIIVIPIIIAFIIIHLYMVIREEIMGNTTLVSAMFNGFKLVRLIKQPKKN